MSLTKKLVCEWASYATIFQTASNINLREQPIIDSKVKINAMVTEGKTDGILHELSTNPTYITERYWSDQSAAEEWETYLNTILSPAAGVSIVNIQITDAN
jgi:hypothetical protein